MKKSIKYLILAAIFSGGSAIKTAAQDIPLFSQKLSNSFMYNPSIAGQQYGSLTLAHRSLFSKVEGSQKDIFFSAHKPFFDKNIGIGINVFSEQVNFVNNLFASGAFAYHFPISDGKLLSLGVSGEYNSLGIDRSEIIGTMDDPIVADRFTRLDFSTGASLLTNQFELGFAVNRLASLMDLADDANLLSAFYSAHYKHKIRIANGTGLIEPMVNYRQLSSVSNIWSVGGFYTYNNLLLAGASYQSSNTVSLTLGGNVMKKIWAGFSYQTHINNYRQDLGGSLEFVVRYDIDRTEEALQKSHFKKSKASKKAGKKAKKQQRKNQQNRR